MPRKDPELKAILLAKGSWGDFRRSREDFQAQGFSNVESKRKAMELYLLPEEMPERKKPGRKPKVAVVAEEVKPGPDPREVQRREAAKRGPAVEMAEAGSFKGKRCSEAETIRWVGQNMYVDGVEPADCPDPTAWNMLQQCRTSPLFCTEFWKTIYTKIVPNKNTLGKSGPTVDESEEKLLEMIGKILDISSDIKAGKR